MMNIEHLKCRRHAIIQYIKLTALQQQIFDSIRRQW